MKQSGLWSWNPSNFGWLQPELKNFEWWNWSLKFEFPFKRRIWWSKPIVQTIQWFLFFNGPNHSGAAVKNFQSLEPEPNILDAWS